MTKSLEKTKSKIIVRNKDLLYPELSYAIIGCAFCVYNELGPVIMKNIINGLSQNHSKSRNCRINSKSTIPFYITSML